MNNLHCESPITWANVSSNSNGQPIVTKVYSQRKRFLFLMDMMYRAELTQTLNGIHLSCFIHLEGFYSIKLEQTIDFGSKVQHWIVSKNPNMMPSSRCLPHVKLLIRLDALQEFLAKAAWRKGTSTQRYTIYLQRISMEQSSYWKQWSCDCRCTQDATEQKMWTGAKRLRREMVSWELDLEEKQFLTLTT